MGKAAESNVVVGFPAEGEVPAASDTAASAPGRRRANRGREVAVIRDLSTNEGLRLSKGMQYKGWTLEAVEPDRALLKRGDNQVHELKLEQKK